jgi:hypothetical protein
VAAVLAVVAPALADRGKSSAGFGHPKTVVSHGGKAKVAVQGVVQSVSSSAVVIRQLDGSTVSVEINRSTRITIDGHPGKSSDVKLGFVLVTTVEAGQPASTLRFLRPS